MKILRSFFLLSLGLFAIVRGGFAAETPAVDTLGAIRERGYVIVGNKQVFPTMNFRDATSGRNEGFFADIARALAKHLLGDESKVQFHLVNDENRFPKLMTGEVDFLIDTIPTSPEKEELAARSTETFRSGSGLLVRKGSPIRGVEDLRRGTRVAFVNANEDIALLKSRAPEAEFIACKSSPEAFQALKDGRADAFTQVVTHLFRAASQDRDFIVVERFTTKPYYIFLRKGDAAAQARVNEFLSELRASGEYDRIFTAAFGEFGGEVVK